MIQIVTVVEKQPVVVALSAFALALGWGCAAGDLYRPGDSEVPQAAPNASAQPAPPPPVRWEHASAVGTMKVLQDTSPSHGHKLEALNLRILGSAEAATAFAELRPGDALPRGAILVAQHTARANGTPDGLFAMVKREPGYFPQGGDWEWVAVSADGNVRSKGKLEACARCHADAAVDFVFPPPAVVEPLRR